MQLFDVVSGRMAKEKNTEAHSAIMTTDKTTVAYLILMATEKVQWLV